MSQLLGMIHGREETFPPALLAEINARQAGVSAESIEVAGVEALARSPYRILVDRIASKIGYFQSFLAQHALSSVPTFPALRWHNLDRVGLAQLALNARVQALPTLLLPHQAHPPGIEAEDLGNLAYPMPWEQYMQRIGLPGCLRSAQLGPGPVRCFSSLSELWQLYARTQSTLHVIQPDLENAHHLMVLMVGPQPEVLGYEPLTGRYLPKPVPESWAEQAREASFKLQSQGDLFMTGLEFTLHGSKLWLSDLHLYPDLEWWSLGEETFTRIVQSCAQELIARTLEKSAPAGSSSKTVAGKAKSRVAKSPAR
jgi:hypothetical protein